MFAILCFGSALTAHIFSSNDSVNPFSKQGTKINNSITSFMSLYVMSSLLCSLQ